MGALLVGVSAAKMLAVALDVPLIGVNHVEATSTLPAGRGARHLSLRRPGGQRRTHVPVPLPRRRWHFELLGGTLDDAAGEAFDKVASLLGLGFPGGPAVEREAASRRPDGRALPAPFSTKTGWISASAV